jgi:hypothetical protein
MNATETKTRNDAARSKTMAKKDCYVITWLDINNNERELVCTDSKTAVKMIHRFRLCGFDVLDVYNDLRGQDGN